MLEQVSRKGTDPQEPAVLIYISGLNLLFPLFYIPFTSLCSLPL